MKSLLLDNTSLMKGIFYVIGTRFPFFIFIQKGLTKTILRNMMYYV